MSSREMFDLEPGDTGEALLPAVGKPACSAASGTQAYPEHGSASAEADKVNGKGAWLPEGSDPVWGDVRHHRERIDQLKGWVIYWRAKALEAEAALDQHRGKCSS